MRRRELNTVWLIDLHILRFPLIEFRRILQMLTKEQAIDGERIILLVRAGCM